MPDQELPDCPYCQHHDRVEKVSALVERTFPVPPGDIATIQKEYRLVRWGGKSYYVNKRYFKREIPKVLKPHGLSFLIGKNSSTKQLLSVMVKYSVPGQGYNTNFVPENPAQEADITGLMLLPILEKPGPLPQNTSFKRFFLEVCLFLAWWYLAGFLVALLGFVLHLLFLILLVEAYLIVLAGVCVLGALVYKLLAFLMRFLE